MRKSGHILITVFLVGFAYILMMLFQPTVNNMVETSNSSIDWTGHESFEYAQVVLIGWPFWSYLVPVTIGTAVVIKILKGE